MYAYMKSRGASGQLMYTKVLYPRVAYDTIVQCRWHVQIETIFELSKRHSLRKYGSMNIGHLTGSMNIIAFPALKQLSFRSIFELKLSD